MCVCVCARARAREVCYVSAYTRYLQTHRHRTCTAPHLCQQISLLNHMVSFPYDHINSFTHEPQLGFPRRTCTPPLLCQLILLRPRPRPCPYIPFSARLRPYIPLSARPPSQANKSDFPVTPGAPMPPVTGCEKQDYAVLFVLGAEA